MDGVAGFPICVRGLVGNCSLGDAYYPTKNRIALGLDATASVSGDLVL